ncbi:helix-turn-helix domain-containing protein [Labrys sp. KNU-23]|uniref:helix-turn-helix domain-containing protein n=1 Tax=Labrys sp. KNU-23 TaxID=2789216 RepID=UPI0011EC70CD|nr:XRE family transcriptional regulator [Labrys sp. KNU-23]QEN90780.1 helix-turn-helix domain-containing protein [Labrys sp. KNU-23]
MADVLVHVGANVRRLRAAAGLSQAALAEASGLSRRLIVAVEAGDANISLANLDRLAGVLGVDFGAIVRDPGQAGNQRVDQLGWRGAHPDSRAAFLGAAPARQAAELWIWSLGPGDRYEALPDAEGWREMLYVIEGGLTVETSDGNEIVAAGDFLIFDSAQSYAYVNTGENIVRFVRNVVS